MNPFQGLTTPPKEAKQEALKSAAKRELAKRVQLPKEKRNG